MKLIINQEFKALIPPLTEDEYKGLELSIMEEGCRDAIINWNGIIIDGHNRFEICNKHNVHYKTYEMDFLTDDEAKIWIIDNQFARRNLNDFQKTELALLKEGFIAKKAKEQQIRKPDSVCQISDKQKIDTKKEVAKIAGVSHDTVAKVKKIKEKAPLEVIESLRKGDVSINAAYKDVKKEEKIQNRDKQIQILKDDIDSGKLVLPEGKYENIVFDPPWKYPSSYNPESRRVASPYPEMNIEEINNIELPSSDDCILWFWTTHSFIFDAKAIMNSWGFDYKGMIVWDKDKMGVGYWLRMQCEFCLLGIKGKPLWNVTDLRDIIKEPRREHSRKPDSFYKMINDNFIGRKLDYFSREKREGWDSFGAEPEKF